MNKQDFRMNQCIFCGVRAENEINLGQFLKSKTFGIHYYCLLLSTTLPQNGKDSEGILGFLEEDILKEHSKCISKHCTYCKKPFASITCNKNCRAQYHLPCGLKHGALYQFTSNFISFCKKCRPKPKLSEFLKDVSDCPICLTPYNENDDPLDFFRTTCCKNQSLIHISCLKSFALNSGYFTKCPMCSNKKNFRNSIKKAGVFIPDRDATWEIEMFEEETETNPDFICNAENCFYEFGKESHNDEWNLIYCTLCGGDAVHSRCTMMEDDEYFCKKCIQIKGEAFVEEEIAKKGKFFENLFENRICLNPIQQSTKNPAYEDLWKIRSLI